MTCIFDIPQEVRLTCWDYLTLIDFVALDKTCRLFHRDRSFLDPTRIVDMPCTDTLDFLYQLESQHNGSPLALQWKHPAVNDWGQVKPYPSVRTTATTLLSNVMQLNLSSQSARLQGAFLMLCCKLFPQLHTITLTGTLVHWYDWFLFARTCRSLPLRRIEWHHSTAVFYWCGYDLSALSQLECLDLQDSVLQLNTTVEDQSTGLLKKCPSRFRRVCLKNVKYRDGSGRILPLSQESLVAFARRHATTLEYFTSDLDAPHRATLQRECPHLVLR